MPHRPAPRLRSVLSGLLLLALGIPLGAAEHGFPLIQTYQPALVEASTQNLDLTTDSRGIVYVGNGSGALVYDGAWWRLIPVGKAQTVFSIAAGAEGRVGVGGLDELGYLAPTEEGELHFVSLAGQIPAAERRFGQVVNLIAHGSGFAFLTDQWLRVWDGRRMTLVARFQGVRPLANIFPVDRDVYLWRPEGLFRLVGSDLKPVPGGDVFRDRRVDLVLPADDGGLLVSVRGQGLYLLRNGEAKPFAPVASRWTAEKRLYNGRRLADGRWALGSVLGGALLLRPNGEIDQLIDTRAGLSDDFVSGMSVDREGSLWLSLNNGLARVEVSSPLTVIDRRADLQGTIYDVVRHQGRIWAATSEGLFSLDQTATFMPNIPPAAWSLASMGDDLIVGSGFGIYVVREGKAVAVPQTEDFTAYSLAPSRVDPDRIWVGTNQGLTSIRREKGTWRLLDLIAGSPRDVQRVVEGAHGSLWCFTDLDGSVRIDLPPGGPAKVTPIPLNEASVLVQLGDRILTAEDGRIKRLDEDRNVFVPDPELAGITVDGLSHAVEDSEGNVWLASDPPILARRRPGGGWDTRSLLEIPARSTTVLYAEPDGPVWIGTENGLLRYARPSGGARAPLQAPLLARVTTGRDKVLFGGAPGITPKSAELPANVRRLRIDLAPLSFRKGLRYQTRLAPLDSQWSPLTPEPFAELTRLPPGEYVFNARTVSPDGEQGPPTAWSFTVADPWYQTPWAIALWLTLGVVLMTGYAQLRGLALQKRAARLEARVAEQTDELRRTVEELRQAHGNLEAANSRLADLSLRDDLTGIANRRRLHQVLSEEWSRAQRHQRPVAFILLDLDHFKLLNDTRGHLAGDLCLQAVCQFLESAVKRTGDLAARYGGEELAVLLPDTDLDGAIDLAEELREGIEALDIPHGAAPLGKVTASFGVAARVPAEGDDPESLIELADAALYRAKTDGRNRVRADREPPRMALLH